VAEGLLVAYEIAAFGLFALDHYLDRITSFELGYAVDVQHLLQRYQTFRLEPDVDDNALVGDFDYGAANDDLFDGQVLGGGRLGGLLAMKFASAAAKSAAS